MDLMDISSCMCGVFFLKSKNLNHTADQFGIYHFKHYLVSIYIYASSFDVMIRGGNDFKFFKLCIARNLNNSQDQITQQMYSCLSVYTFFPLDDIDVSDEKITPKTGTCSYFFFSYDH